MTKHINVLEHNQAAWDRECAQGSPWSTPVDRQTIAQARRGEWTLILTPTKPVPRSWFGPIQGKDVLCLASGGGQQAPVLAAAGAQVVSFDASAAQLAKDREVAERDGLDVKTLQGDMADLSVFADASFDLVFHPVANVFVPEVKRVWRECFRVLRPGGTLLAGCMNPVFFLVDHDEAERSGRLEIRFPLPYSDLDSLPGQRLQELIRAGESLQFGHSLEDQIGGLIEAGFVITGFYEDHWSDEATPLNRYTPTSLALRASKPAAQASA